MNRARARVCVWIEKSLPSEYRGRKKEHHVVLMWPVPGCDRLDAGERHQFSGAVPAWSPRPLIYPPTFVYLEASYGGLRCAPATADQLLPPAVPCPLPKKGITLTKVTSRDIYALHYPRRTHCAYPTVVVVGSLLRNYIAPDCSACPTKCCDALGCSGPHARCTVGAIEFFFGWKARVILRITSCTFSRSICTLLTFLIATGYGTRFAARGGNYIPHHH